MKRTTTIKNIIFDTFIKTRFAARLPLGVCSPLKPSQKEAGRCPSRCQRPRASPCGESRLLRWRASHRRGPWRAISRRTWTLSRLLSGSGNPGCCSFCPGGGLRLSLESSFSCDVFCLRAMSCESRSWPTSICGHPFSIASESATCCGCSLSAYVLCGRTCSSGPPFWPCPCC